MKLWKDMERKHDWLYHVNLKNHLIIYHYNPRVSLPYPITPAVWGILSCVTTIGHN